MIKMYVRDRLLWGLAVGGEIVDKIESGGSRAYHRSKLYTWTPTKYSKRKYQDMVNRMHREGFLQRVIIDGKLNFRLTGAGRRQLIENKPVIKMAGEKWDGFWRVVMFDIPERKRSSRDKFRRHLEGLGFGRLQSSTYVSPYDYGKLLLDFIQARGLSGNVLMMEAKQKYLGKPKMVASKVWGLDKIAGGYERVIDRLSTRFGIKDQRKREEFLKKVYEQYLQVLIQDPFLPEELLPEDWPDEKCKKYILRADMIKE